MARARISPTARKQRAFPDLLAKMSEEYDITEQELMSLISKEYDIPLSDPSGGRRKYLGKRVPTQQMDEAYDALTGGDFASVIESRVAEIDKPSPKRVPEEKEFETVGEVNGEPLSVREQTPEERKKVAAANVGGEPLSAREQTPEEKERLAAVMAGERTSVEEYDPTKNEMYGSDVDSDYDPTKNDMYGSGPEAEEPAPPKAVRVSPEELEEDYGQEAISLFKNTHGTEFDPKSSADKKKLEKMKSMLAKQGGLGNMSPNQFALQVYRNS